MLINPRPLPLPGLLLRGRQRERPSPSARTVLPSEYGTDLRIWYDADDRSAVTVDGSGNVTQLADKSGNGLHAVQIGTEPLPVVAPDVSPTGCALVHFKIQSGSLGCLGLTGATALHSFFGLLKPCTFACYVEFPTSDTGVLWDIANPASASTANRYQVIANDSSNMGSRVIRNAMNQNSKTCWGRDGTGLALVVRYDGATLKFASRDGGVVNDEEGSVAEATNISGLSALTFSGQRAIGSPPGNRAQFYLGEFFALSRALTDDEMRAARESLWARWNNTWTREQP